MRSSTISSVRQVLESEFLGPVIVLSEICKHVFL